MDDVFLTRVTERTEHMAHVTVLGTVAECSEGLGQAGTYYCQTQSVHKSPLARNQILRPYWHFTCTPGLQRLCFLPILLRVRNAFPLSKTTKIKTFHYIDILEPPLRVGSMRVGFS